MLDELTVRRAVEGARAEFLPDQRPSQAVIDADVKACLVAGGFGQFFKDIHSALPVAGDPIINEKAQKFDQIRKITN